MPQQRQPDRARLPGSGGNIRRGGSRYVAAGEGGVAIGGGLQGGSLRQALRDSPADIRREALAAVGYSCALGDAAVPAKLLERIAAVEAADAGHVRRPITVKQQTIV